MAVLATVVALIHAFVDALVAFVDDLGVAHLALAVDRDLHYVIANDWRRQRPTCALDSHNALALDVLAHVVALALVAHVVVVASGHLALASAPFLAIAAASVFDLSPTADTQRLCRSPNELRARSLQRARARDACEKHAQS